MCEIVEDPPAMILIIVNASAATFVRVRVKHQMRISMGYYREGREGHHWCITTICGNNLELFFSFVVTTNTHECVEKLAVYFC